MHLYILLIVWVSYLWTSVQSHQTIEGGSEAKLFHRVHDHTHEITVDTSSHVFKLHLKDVTEKFWGSPQAMEGLPEESRQLRFYTLKRVSESKEEFIWARAAGFINSCGKMTLISLRFAVREDGKIETYTVRLLKKQQDSKYEQIMHDEMDRTGAVYVLTKLSDLQALNGDGNNDICDAKGNPLQPGIYEKPNKIVLTQNEYNEWSQSATFRKIAKQKFVCSMAFSLHKTWMDAFPDPDYAVNYALTVINEIQGMLSAFYPVKFNLLALDMIKSEDHPSGLGNTKESSSMNILNLMKAALRNKLFSPHYQSIQENVCVHHSFSMIHDKGILGLAEVGKQHLQYENVGTSSPKAKNKIYSYPLFPTIAGHEVSHQLGSSHDVENPFSPECAPSKSWLMSPKLPTGSNSVIPSKCSYFNVTHNMAMTPSKFIPEYMDECAQNPAIQKLGNFVLCREYFKENACDLYCQKKEDTGLADGQKSKCFKVVVQSMGPVPRIKRSAKCQK